LAKRILVVEDEPTLVATLRYNLERDGYDVRLILRYDIPLI
jgi:DNA-binding response OmpR family regulator